MLDEKVQDAEHTLLSVKEESKEEKELIAAKVDELTTALQNLKWGFKERQESMNPLVTYSMRRLIHLRNLTLFESAFRILLLLLF